MKFGEELRKRRKEAGKTLGDVARAVGCKVSYLSDVELSRRNPFKTPQILAIAELLRCDARPLILAAADERGGVTIEAANPRLSGIAASMARSAERFTPETLAKLEELMKEYEE